MSEPRTAHVSAIELDLHQMGDLSPERTRALLAHLEECEVCRKRKAELAGSYGEFSAQVFPRTAPALRATSARPKSKVAIYKRPFIWAPGIAAAAAVLLFVKTGMFGSPPPSMPAPGDLTTKGGANFSLVARRGEQALPVATDRPVQLEPGDEVKFVVTSGDPGQRYLLVAALDAAGVFSVYHPFGGSTSAQLPHAGRLELPETVVLDATPGAERVVAVLSPTPIPAEAVRTQLLAAQKLDTDAAERLIAQAWSGAEAKTLVIVKPAGH